MAVAWEVSICQPKLGLELEIGPSIGPCSIFVGSISIPWLECLKLHDQFPSFTGNWARKESTTGKPNQWHLICNFFFPLLFFFGRCRQVRLRTCPTVIHWINSNQIMIFEWPNSKHCARCDFFALLGHTNVVMFIGRNDGLAAPLSLVLFHVPVLILFWGSNQGVPSKILVRFRHHLKLS